MKKPKNKGGIAMKKLATAPYARFSAVRTTSQTKKAP